MVVLKNKSDLITLCMDSFTSKELLNMALINETMNCNYDDLKALDEIQNKLFDILDQIELTKKSKLQ